jgi:hypothetical protein
VLRRRRISPVHRVWHVPRLAAVRPTRTGEVSAKQVTGFFLKRARERRLTDWQFRQIVDAVQLLPVDLAQVPVNSAPKLDDWRAWKSGTYHQKSQTPLSAVARRHANFLIRCWDFRGVEALGPRA